MAFDSRCYDLAVEFLEEVTPTPQDHVFDELAQVIQDAIEDYLHVPDEPLEDIEGEHFIGTEELRRR